MFTVVEHPLIQVHIARMRDESTDGDAFGRHLTAIARLMAFPALQDLTVALQDVQTPLRMTQGAYLPHVPVLVPVLRAGLGMVEGFRDVIPNAVVSHLGMYRDHQTLQPIRYYSNFPSDRRSHPFVVLDPMLATGGSAVDSVDFLKSEGAQNIRLVAILAAPEGIARFTAAHQDVGVYTAALDERLDERGYILPGLGDAGDRQFGTV